MPSESTRRFRVSFEIEGTRLADNLPLQRRNLLAFLGLPKEEGNCHVEHCHIEELSANRRDNEGDDPRCKYTGRNLQRVCSRRAIERVKERMYCQKHALQVRFGG